jgi:hypothetical protein
MAELDGRLAAAAAAGGAASPGDEVPSVAQLQAVAAKYLAGRPWVEVVVD